MIESIGIFYQRSVMSDSNKSRRFRGYLEAVAGGILWGFSGNCSQYLFSSCDVTPKWLLPIRMVSTGIILLVVSGIKNKSNTLGLWKRKKILPRFAFFILFGLIGCQFTYYSAIDASNAGTATVLQYLSPAMILIYLCLSEKRKPVISEVVAIALAMAGTFLIATGGSFNSFTLSPFALIMGIASAVFLAVYSIVPRPILKEFDTPTVLGWGMLIGGIILTPIVRPWINHPAFTPSLILAMAGIVIFGTVIAYTLYLDSIKLIGAGKASVLSSVEPVSATVISAAWLGTGFGKADIIGMILIISTILIISLSDKER